jgi:hypothetical protein
MDHLQMRQRLFFMGALELELKFERKKESISSVWKKSNFLLQVERRGLCFLGGGGQLMILGIMLLADLGV